jgi:DNA-binding CsgD family transcriptional regulator
MIEAVRTVAKGEPVLSPSVTRQVIAAATGGREPQRPEAQREPAKLTERECEVAIEVARGSSNAEIAERLYMSVATVKANITRIFSKLGTDNRVQVAMRCATPVSSERALKSYLQHWHSERTGVMKSRPSWAFSLLDSRSLPPFPGANLCGATGGRGPA